VGAADDERDLEAVHAKYLHERDKRLVPGRADIRDLTRDEHFARFRADPFTPRVERAPIVEEVDVVIVGGGIAGVLAGANLRKAGVERIRIVDQAGGIGGTWYWNRYPGVMCDVESYIYLPMLEELDYVPTHRYAFGDEIRSYLQALAERFDLVDDALFHTGVNEAAWDETAGRWRVRTDRGDTLTTTYYVLAVGILNLMKLPAIPGMDRFQGASFHTARWDYGYTGGGPDEPLTRLGDKVVALIGTGASGIQCIPPLAEAARHLYVFQRTPSAIGVRGNRPTDAEFSKALEPGWQRARMDNFQSIMLGRPVDQDLVDDGWTRHFAAVHHPPRTKGMTIEEYLRSGEEVDLSIMEEHRRRVAEIVTDTTKAEVLKPYYRYLCKRPCFHDEYLDSYNQPGVHLIDTDGKGVERITAAGVVVAGVEYPLNCLIYASGFEVGTEYRRRAGFDLVGRDGLKLSQHWKDGMRTKHGMHVHGFPNAFFVQPTQGANLISNVPHNLTEAGRTIAIEVRHALDHGFREIEVTKEAEDAWVSLLLTGMGRMTGGADCTPGYYNNEGQDAGLAARLAVGYPAGASAYFSYIDEWRRSGRFEGLTFR
jgi:cation diffusion facilitator CzcD-associated flavoprotein CzcO